LTKESTLNLEDKTLTDPEEYTNSVEYLCINCGASVEEENTLIFYEV